MRFLNLLLLLLGTLLYLAPAHAQNSEEENLLKIRLIPEYGQIKPHQEIWIGIEQTIAPHWHSYWKNPGDSGSAPRIKWHLPEGFEITDIHWPTPSKIPYGPLLNYGYSNQVTLLQKLKAPGTLPDTPLNLSVDLDILVCKDECIPQFFTQKLTLNTPETKNINNAENIANAVKKLPQETNRPFFFEEKDGKFLLSAPLRENDSFTKQELESFEFFPADWGIVKNTAHPETRIAQNKAILINQDRDTRGLSNLKTTDGVLTYTDTNGQFHAWSFTAHNNKAILQTIAHPTAPTPTHAAQDVANTGLIHALLWALLGGIILNLMPCVFPVLSLKAISLVKTAEKHPRQAKLHGLVYTAGIILSFLVVAGILIALKSSGAAIGWGFQLQNPTIVALLAYLLFIIGLNFAGFFEIKNHFGNLGNKLTQGDGLANSFFTGVLATIVATPCTAPFMATAIGYALLQPASISLSIFAALGFGLALPYLALSFIPAAQRILPKPGPWMATFQSILSIPMFGFTIWLLWVLKQQTHPFIIVTTILGMLFLTIGFYLTHLHPKKGWKKIALRSGILLCFALPLALLPNQKASLLKPIDISSMEFGETFTPEKLEQALASPNPVFVEMTAAWCITCKVNHSLAINTETTHKALQDNNVRYLIGDWTNYDETITEFLNRYGHQGVPLYVFYGAPDENGERPDEIILPQILGPNTIKNTIERSSTN